MEATFLTTRRPPVSRKRKPTWPYTEARWYVDTGITSYAKGQDADVTQALTMELFTLSTIWLVKFCLLILYHRLT